MDGARTSGTGRHLIRALLAVLLVAGSMSLLPGPVAHADSAPADPTAAATPPTVTADALPTVQVDGVVWSQVVVGDTVYAAGSFTSARPAGAAAGTNETPRANLLAYSISTGALVTSFAPSLNAQALVVTASPDGSRIYVGGDFSTADGQARKRIAAYDTATGALVSSFHPSVNGQVRGIAVTGSTVYVGGSFGSVGSVSRTNLAAFSAADGSLLPWAPVPGPGPTDGNNDPKKTSAQNQALDYSVMALVSTGGGSQVVAAGRFDTMDGDKATGVAALDPTTGADRPFAINQLITNQGINSAIDSLSTSADGNTVFGTGYDFYGPGNLEGAFEATADGGALVAIDDCHGDTYSSYAAGPVLYLSSHAHDCGNIGGFPEENPRINKFATAFTTAALGSVGPDTEQNTNFVGKPAVAPLDWFPALTAGAVTGQNQAGWSVTGRGGYVVYGGEFPKVNGVAQAGLVRFAVPATAPNKVGPNWNPGLNPTLVPMSGGLRVSWQSTWDQDNQQLTYKVFRSDQPGTPVFSTTAPSTFWQRPNLGFTDTSVRAGTSYTYQVYAYDPFGNLAKGSPTSATATATSTDAYRATVLGDHPSDYWRLDEPVGSTTSYDQAAFADLAQGTGVTDGVAGALTGTTDTAAAFDGASDGLAATTSPVDGPQVFSVEAWFSTTSTSGGKIVGFGNTNSGLSSSYDRHVFMDGAGTVYFGVYPGFTATVQSNRPYNDGAWHHVVATLGPTGMALYLDGQLAGQRGDVTSAQPYSGFWRVGGDNSWAGSSWFAGSVDEVAVYPTVLTPDQVAAHHEVGTTGQPYDHPPVPAFTSTSTGTAATFDGSGSSDPDGTVTGYSWDFGDGTTGTGPTAGHTYAAPGTYRVGLTVTDGIKQATATRVLEVTATGSPSTAYAQAVESDGATAYWRLGETSGPGYDWVGTDDLTVGSGVTRATPGAIAGDQDAAATFDGTPNGLAVAQTQLQGPDTFSVEAWFRTTSTSGGKIVGFGDQPSGWSSNYDRHVYMDGSGTVYFGVWTGQTTTVQSAPGFNDGAWHHVVATLGSGGLAMYLDGALVGRNTSATAGQSYRGYWRIGGDNTWAGAPFFAGSVDDVAIYPTVLTDAQVAAHHRLGAPPADQPPTASFTSSVSGLTAAVDGSASVDPDGSVAGYAWDFGDGSTGSGATASHTYAAAGTYTVRLTVTDNGGSTGSTTAPVTVSVPNQPPTASFTSAASGLSVSVDASGSSDPDGTVTGYAWDFGDGTAAGSGRTASHTYTSGGTYTVTLTVTDDAGATGTTTSAVTVTAPNRPPTASFTSSPAGLTVAVDGSASTDPDGSVAGYAWSFGDGTTGSGKTASHAYTAGGTYTVTLTVTDDSGATGSTSSSVTVTAPPAANQPPTASFTSSPSGLTLGVDGSGSSDPDGTVAGYAWDFGDGGTSASGATASHTYARAGTYTVRLTVTDDGGATGTTSATVTVTAPPTILAADSFKRTTTGGWGTADTGGAWTSVYGAARLSVAPGTASMSLSAVANLDEAVLGGVSQTSSNTLAALSVTGTQTGGGTSVYLVGRRAGTNQEYRARLRFLANGSVGVAITRLSGTASETVLGAEVVVPGLTYTSGLPLQARFVVTGTGTTQLAATVWTAGSAEPATPTLTRTDTTASLQVAGGVGLAGYLSKTGTPPVTVRFTGYQVTDAG